MTEVDLIEIRDTLEMALGNPHVYLTMPFGANNPDSPDTEETEAELITRYWIYWNEFAQDITQRHQHLIIRWCIFNKLQELSKQFGIDPDQARQIIDNALDEVASKIHHLLTTCKTI